MYCYLRNIVKIFNIKEFLKAKFTIYTIEGKQINKDAILFFPSGLVSIDDSDVLLIKQDNQNIIYGSQIWIQKASELVSVYNLQNGDKLFGRNGSVVISRASGKIEIQNSNTQINLDTKIELKNETQNLMTLINNMLNNYASLLTTLQNAKVFNPITQTYTLQFDNATLNAIQSYINSNTQLISNFQELLK